MTMKMRYPTTKECEKRMTELGFQREELYRQKKEIVDQLQDIEREYTTCRKIIQHHKKEDDPSDSE